MKHAKNPILPALLVLAAATGLTSCGGGSSGNSTPVSGNTGSVNPSSNSAAPANPQALLDSAPVQPSIALPALNLPVSIANGSTVDLECGRTYRGTLDVRGKTGVTVRTAGSCGKAVISPGRNIDGWVHYQGNIYSAPIDFTPAQLMAGGQPLTLAHWPAREQTWMVADATSATTLRYAMPSADLAGATLVFRPYDWAVESRTITGYANNTMTLASSGNPNVDGYALEGRPGFYVEGKLWMLDEPGEWVASGGRIYAWMPDGQSPQGRTWASPASHGIDAANSSGVTIEAIAVYGAADGIHGADARNLVVRDVDIANSSGNGVMNSGGSGLQIEGGSILNSRHDAVAVKWGGGSERIRNVRIDSAGSIGMPANAHAAINLTVGSGAIVSNNTVTRSGYIGIRTFRDSVVTGNVVDGACLTLTDCGGIFNSARDGLPLNARIEGNTIRNVGVNQRLAWAIYLSDGANVVTVTGNTIAGSGNGMLIFDGHDNTVAGNSFSASTQAHIQMAETVGGRVRRNSLTGNTFSALTEETYRFSSDAGTASVQGFLTADGNRYTSGASVFANFNGEPLSYSQWKQRTAQDASSTFSMP